MEFQIISIEELKDIPSASGIIKSGNKYYVVGDDSPFLFCLDHNFNHLSKTEIYSLEMVEGNKITKKHKPDFEAMEMITAEEFAIFGSGSKSPERDYFVRVNVKNGEVKTHQISDFYNFLKSQELLRKTELNIEAAAEYEGTLILFNRKKNLVISFSYAEFVDHIEKKTPVPEISIVEVPLPEIKGIEAGFSGATAFHNKPILIFTASVEDTQNAYDDGKILGSYIGLLDMHTLKIIGEMQPVNSPDEKDGPVKVESVAIDKVMGDNELQLILTTDSDGGKSVIFRALLKL